MVCVKQQAGIWKRETNEKIFELLRMSRDVIAAKLDQQASPYPLAELHAAISKTLKQFDQTNRKKK